MQVSVSVVVNAGATTGGAVRMVCVLGMDELLFTVVFEDEDCELPALDAALLAVADPPADFEIEVDPESELDPEELLPLLTGATEADELDPELAPDTELDGVVMVLVLPLLVGATVAVAPEFEPEFAPDTEFDGALVVIVGETVPVEAELDPDWASAALVFVLVVCASTGADKDVPTKSARITSLFVISSPPGREGRPPR